MLELQPGDAELIDFVLLGGGQVAPDTYEALTRSELGVDLGGAKVREDPDELAGGLGCINDLLWIAVKRWAVKGRGEDIAVAVNDSGMARHRGRHDPKARVVRLGAPAPHPHPLRDQPDLSSQHARTHRAHDKAPRAVVCSRVSRR